MQCINFYTQFIKDPNLLAQGHILIRNYLLQSQTNRSDTLRHLLHPSPPIMALVGSVYAVDVYPALGEQQKSITRAYLMQVLLNAINKEGVRSKNVDALLQMMRKMHHQEGYSSWISLYAKLIQNVNIEYFGDLIINILESADNRISDLSTNIFVYVIQAHAKYNLTTEKVLEILFYCVKSFAYMCGTDDEKLDAFYKPYEQQFVDFIWRNLRTSPLCMKFGFKLLSLLYAQMNYALSESQSSKTNMQSLTVFGLQICQQYVKTISNPAYSKSFNMQQYAQQFEELSCTKQQSANSIAENIHVIMFQLFEFYEVLLLQDQDEQLQHSGHELNGIHILVSALLGAVQGVNEMQYWQKNSSEYIVAVENQHEVVLRNKCSQLVYLLVDSHENKQEHIQFMESYFHCIAYATRLDPTAALACIQQFINRDKIAPAQITLMGQFSHYQQSAYFILSSTIDMLFKNQLEEQQKRKRKSQKPKQTLQQKQQMLKFLIQRAVAVQNSITKIQTILIIVGQMKQPPQQNLKQFVFAMINRFGSNEQLLVDRWLDDIGVALALGRGLGKICCSEYVQIGKDIPCRYIEALISYLMNITSDRMLEEDGSHIALELIIRITDCNKFKPHNDPAINQNKTILSKLFTTSFQEAMLTHYMNDIYLSSMIIELLNAYPLQETITFVVHMLLQGAVHNQKYVELIVKWLQSGHVYFNSQHILTLLQCYQGNRRSIIEPIIKSYLNWLVKNKNTQNTDSCTTQIAYMLNNAPDQTWLVAMLQCGILADPAQVLVKCIQKITYQITSQYELQCKMVLPFYLGIHETQNFMQVLQSQPNLYKEFLEKLFRYAQLFRGQNLKIISSLFWLKLSEFDRALVTKTVSLIQSYGELAGNEWEDQLDIQTGRGQNQQDIMERLMGGKIQNEQMEKQLQELFKDLSWNSEQIKKKLLQLNQKR